MSLTLHVSSHPALADGVHRVLQRASPAVLRAWWILLVIGCGASGAGADGANDSADGGTDIGESDGAVDAADVVDATDVVDAAEEVEHADPCPALVDDFAAVELAHGYNDSARPAPGAAGWVVPLLDVASADAALCVMPVSRDAPAAGPMTTAAGGARGALGWQSPALVWTGEESVGLFQSADFGHPVAQVVRLSGVEAIPTGDPVALDDTGFPTGSAVGVWSDGSLAVAYAAWTDGTERAELRFRRFDRNLTPLSSPRTTIADAALTFAPRDLAFSSEGGVLLWTEWPVSGATFELAWVPIAPDGTGRGEPQSAGCGAARPGCGSVAWTGREYFVLYCCIDDGTGMVDSWVQRLAADGSTIEPAAALAPGRTLGFPIWDGNALVVVTTETFPDLHARLALQRYHPDTGDLDAPLWEHEGPHVLQRGMAFADERLFLLWTDGTVGSWSVMARGWRCAPAKKEETP
ncbi:MAG: hypothetical protein JXB32_12145 [Deltaproteobacteria bacterium]|nr:hypothetical protein [Deltaproteobacteria bacterium]